jgi:small-conductance mechanosensitive channel
LRLLRKPKETLCSTIRRKLETLVGLLDSLRRLTASIIIIVLLAAATLTFFEVFISAPTNLSNQLDTLVNISLVFAFEAMVLYILAHLKRLLTPHLGIQVGTFMQFLFMGLTLTVATLVILSFFNVSLSALLASAGIISVTVGLIISTFVGGILSGALVFTTHKLKIGDDVMVNNMPGKVVDMTGLVVRIRTDVGQITIPNSAIASGGVIITQLRLPEPNQEKRLPYSAGDRIVTSYKNEEGVVTEVTAFHSIVTLDSGKQIQFLNTSVLSGAVAVAKVTHHLSQT